MALIAVLLAHPARHVWTSKGPTETVERHVDWSARLVAGDSIKASAFELPPGLVADAARNTELIATVSITGGEAGQTYEVLNRVTTARGLVLTQAIKLRVKS